MIEYVYIMNWGRRIAFVFKPAPSIMDSDDLIQTLSDDTNIVTLPPNT
jgi:hypothetical protein